MSALAATGWGLLAGEAMRLWKPRLTWKTAAGVAAAAWQPLLAFPAAAVYAVVRWKVRLASQRRASAMAENDLAVLGELTALGLSAGLTFQAALERAAAEVADELRREVHSVLRRSRRDGVAGVMGSAEGRARRLYVLAGRASITGAPVLAAVQAFVDERRNEERTQALEAARKLPVRLMFPLALLILPGFMVLIVGPAVAGALGRLGL
jgi:tight adherence protein C